MSLLEENCNLEKNLKKANFLLEEKKSENDFLLKRSKEKDSKIQDFKEEIMEISLKNESFLNEIKEKDEKIEEILKENEKIKRENEEILERESNLRKFQGQYKILLNRQETEKTRVLKEIESLKKGSEEKERGIYAELLNIKSEKKSLLGKIDKLEKEIKGFKLIFY